MELHVHGGPAVVRAVLDATHLIPRVRLAEQGRHCLFFDHSLGLWGNYDTLCRQRHLPLHVQDGVML